MKKNIRKKNTTKTKRNNKIKAENYFFNNNARFTDSLNDLLDIGVYAQSGGCGGSSSSKADVCFLPDVEITLFDKTRKRIDEIVIGDIVFSYDPIINKTFESKVVNAEHHTRTDGYFIINNHLKVTDDHPIWVNNSWIKVKDIKKDNLLLNFNNKTESVESIEYIEGEVEVYNIKVEGESTTYFANEVLVNSYWKDIV